MAQILIINLTGERVSVTVNGGSAGSVGGARGGSGFELAAPLAVPRGDVAEPGRFGSNSPNALRLAGESGFDAGYLDVGIAGSLWPGSDLQLFLFSKHAVLVADRQETVIDVSYR